MSVVQGLRLVGVERVMGGSPARVWSGREKGDESNVLVSVRFRFRRFLFLPEPNKAGTGAQQNQKLSETETRGWSLLLDAPLVKWVVSVEQSEAGGLQRFRDTSPAGGVR